jgi:hypothetical protein
MLESPGVDAEISATDLLPVEPMVRAGASDPHLRQSLCFLNLLQAAFTPPMLNCSTASHLLYRVSTLPFDQLLQRPRFF